MTASTGSFRAAWHVLLVSLLLAPGLAVAEVRAWLDRDRIELGESATLNIETDGSGRPDYAPLASDFRVELHSSRQSFEDRGGRTVSRTLYAVALRPERTGSLVIPALQVGGERTTPLALEVVEASAAPARRGPAFIEADIDDTTPYVQQSVGLLLRLYYAPQLLSGQFDQPVPDGASLSRAGSDVQYTRDVGGRRYQVIERRYVLVPERSGRLELPPARFRGRGVGGWLDDLFGDGQRALSADGPALVLEVKPMPDAATRPWLPLHGLSMRWLEPPGEARVGDAATVTLEVVADGALAAQLDAPVLVADQGAQVFPDAAQHDETIEDGRPRVRMVRQFAVLPAREGSLRVEAPRLPWWDVDADRARVTTLPPLELDVAPRAPGSGASAGSGPGDAWVRVPGVQGTVRAWALATVAFAFLWLATLAWALYWRQRATAGSGGTDGEEAANRPAASRRGAGMALRKALDTGDLGDVATALCGLASPPVGDLDALARLLAPGPQRDAIALLQQARWGQAEGGAAAARTAVRAAFASGPQWLADDADDTGPLPPLYPR